LAARWQAARLKDGRDMPEISDLAGLGKPATIG
jgi:hypothetical protein